MRQILLSTTNNEENRLAVLDNGKLAEYLSVVSRLEDRRGSILCGIVSEVENSLDACFVDIGDNKKGFLQFGNIHKDCLPEGEGGPGKLLKPGMPILVQITKDSRAQKGPLLTTHVKLMSHHLVLLPREKDPEPLKISQKASDEERRAIMDAKELLSAPDAMTMIIRSNGLDRPVEDLAWERNSLISLWDLIQQVFAKMDSPTLIYEYRSIVNICLTEYLTRGTSEIVCDSGSTEQEVRDMLETMGGDLSTQVRTVGADEVLFSDNTLKQVDSLMNRRVQLPSGGELVIDITEAMVAVDVNSSRARSQSGIEATALATNLEAATEVALQLKLRNLSGLVVIDFIDMKPSENRSKLENHFRRALRGDRAQTSTGSISQFGLMEMTRQNVGSPLHETHSHLCDKCGGTGRLPVVRAFASSIVDKIREIALNRKQVGTVIAELPIEAATYVLNEKREDLLSIQEDLGVDTIILPSTNMSSSESRFSVEKDRRGGKMESHQRKLQRNLSSDSYINEPKNSRKEMVAALTNVQRNLPRKQQPAGNAVEAAPVVAEQSTAKEGFSFSGFFKSLIPSTSTAETQEAVVAAEGQPRRDNNTGGRGRGRDGNREGEKRKSRSRSKPRSGSRKRGKGGTSGSRGERREGQGGRNRQRGPRQQDATSGGGNGERQEAAAPAEAREAKAETSEAKAAKEPKADRPSEGKQGGDGSGQEKGARPEAKDGASGDNGKDGGAGKESAASSPPKAKETRPDGETDKQQPELPKTAETPGARPDDAKPSAKTPPPEAPLRRDRGNTLRKSS